jgi:hypothetical protein
LFFNTVHCEPLGEAICGNIGVASSFSFGVQKKKKQKENTQQIQRLRRIC